MELEKTHRCLNSILQAMTKKMVDQEALSSVDLELDHCLHRSPMFISVQTQDRHLCHESLFLTDLDSEELLQLHRQGLTNHRFRCTVVPEAASVRAVNLNHFVCQVWDEDEEFLHMKQGNGRRVLIKEFMDQIMGFRHSLVGEDSCRHQLLV